jgi:hypothetical protein
LNGEQYSALTQQLKADAPMKFSTKELAELYSENELASHVDQTYVVLRGGPRKAAAIVPAAALHPIFSDLLLLDSEGHPFFATTVRLLVPNDAR